MERPEIDLKNLRENLKENIHVPDLPDLSFNRHDISRDVPMLEGDFARNGYDWWWHSFTGHAEDTGEEKSFFIEFFTINPALGGPEPVYGQLEENQKLGKRPSYLMVKVGTWGDDACQVSRCFGWDDVTLKKDEPFHVSAGDCFCSETRTLGKVEVTPEDAGKHPEWLSDAGKMIWDLKIDKKIAFNVGYGAGRVFRDTEAFQMFWHVEGMKTLYSGEVVWNGRVYRVRPEDCFGYADKNWGADFTSPWVWLSSCDLTDRKTGEKLKDSAFDIGGGRPKVGHVALDGKLLSAFWVNGTPYEFNFSKFWTLTKTKFSCKESSKELIWKVEQETPMNRVLCEVRCPKKEMLKIRYEAPDGSMRHRNLWNGGTGKGIIKLYRKKISLKNKWEWEETEDLAADHVGCEYGVYEK